MLILLDWMNPNNVALNVFGRKLKSQADHQFSLKPFVGFCLVLFFDSETGIPSEMI